MAWFLWVWLWAVPGFGQGLSLATPDPVVGQARVERQLTAWMDGLLEDPDGFRRTVNAEAHSFPEGSLFPYVFPAMAWTNLASRDPSLRPEAREHLAVLIELMLPAVELATHTPERDLAKLDGYHSQAVMLGQLNLVLGCFKLVGGDDRYGPIHRRISEVLASALREREGKPLDSYPALLWPFDTIPVVLSLHLADPHGYRDAIDAHLEWIDAHGTEPVTGLPYSRLDPRTLAPMVGPRGCDLSYRVALMAQLDPERAAALYRAYTRSFWIRRNVATGFAEWPEGSSDAADIDSGPVVMGIGTAATGLGIAATRAVGDGARWKTLERELNLVQGALRTLGPLFANHPDFKGIPQDLDRYQTGFFFGDICLFWSTTWEPWGRAR